MWLIRIRNGVLALLGFIAFNGHAQQFIDDSLSMDPLDSLMFQSFDIYQDLEEQLIPLDSIMHIAEYGNPQILYQEALVRVGEYNIKNTRSLWMKRTSFFIY